MILLKNEATNTVYLNLEKSILKEDIYIFKIYNKETKEVKIFSALNISDSDNYKKFVITLTKENELLNMAKINIYNGEYSVSIYESNDNTTPYDEQLANTDVNCLKPLKNVIMRVWDDNETPIKVVSSLNTETVVFRKNN